MRIAWISLMALCVLQFPRPISCADLVRGFLQTNVIGFPVIHEVADWPFDPDTGLRRRKSFEEINGIKSEKLIERLGLGVDGRDEERLAQQRKRDEGHLGGLNQFLP